MIKSLLVTLPEDLHWRVKHKCRYYKLSIQEVVSTLLVQFDKGEFDEQFHLPKPTNKNKNLP